MDQCCTVDGHSNQKIYTICCNKACKRKILCAQCFLQDHEGHESIKLQPFFELIKKLQNRNNCNLFQINAAREQCFKNFRQFIESTMKMLDEEFKKHQKYIDQQIKSLIDFDQSYLTETFVEMVLELKQTDLLQKNYEKLEQFFIEQKLFLEHIQLFKRMLLSQEFRFNAKAKYIIKINNYHKRRFRFGDR